MTEHIRIVYADSERDYPMCQRCGLAWPCKDAELAAANVRIAGLLARVGLLEGALTGIVTAFGDKDNREHPISMEDCEGWSNYDDVFYHGWEGGEQKVARVAAEALALSDADAAGIVAVAKAAVRQRDAQKATPYDYTAMGKSMREREEAVDALTPAARALLDGAP